MEKRFQVMLTGRYDGALCKPWFAMRLIPEHKINFQRVADLLDPDNNQWLTGVFIVKKESAINSISDIDGKRLVAGQPDSYEKYHAPLAMLKDGGITPDTLIDRSGCIECIGTLLDDKADVAVISNYALTASCAVDIASPDDFRIIGETAKFPLCSVILDMNKVSAQDAERLRKALLEISGANAPAGLVSTGLVAPADWTPVTFN